MFRICWGWANLCPNKVLQPEIKIAKESTIMIMLPRYFRAHKKPFKVPPSRSRRCKVTDESHSPMLLYSVLSDDDYDNKR